MTHVVLNKRIRVHIGRMQGYICKTDVVLSKTKQPKKKKPQTKNKPKNPKISKTNKQKAPPKKKTP